MNYDHNLRVSTGWEGSARAWIDFVDKGDSNRLFVLDPVMLDLCGSVSGLRVADIGCGEGRFCRMLAERGASVTGVEPTATLVEAARERHPGGKYLQASAEALPLESSAFDLVVSVLALVDVEGFREAISEMVRILKPGGRIVLANSSPWNTANPGIGWHRDEDNRKLHWPVDDYMTERGQKVSWADIHIVNFHRPLGAYMTAFLDEGLILKTFFEPVPTEDALIESPGLADHLRAPFFVVMEWQKPTV